MKMRSIAILAAVVAVSIGALSAQTPTTMAPSASREAMLAGGETGGSVVPSRPISPAPISPAIAPALGAPGMPGAGMPMTPGMPPMAGAPGMQRMPSMTPGMPQAATMGQYATMEAVKTAEELAKTGAKIGEAFATSKAKTDELRATKQIEIDTAQQMAAIEKKKKDDDLARELAISEKINTDTNPSSVAANAAYTQAKVQVKTLNKKVDDAADLGILPSEREQGIIDNALSDVKQVGKAIDLADGLLLQAVAELKVSSIPAIKSAYEKAKRSATEIDLAAAIASWDKKIRAEKASRAAARRPSTSS